jgi:cytochrome P450
VSESERDRLQRLHYSVLTRPSHTRTYFRNSNHHVKAADNNSGWLFGEVLGSCVGLVSGARWHALRNELEPCFTHSAATAHVTTIIEAAKSFVSSELPSPTLDDQTGTYVVPINPSRDLQFFPFFVVAGVLFGVPLSDAQRIALRDLAPLREELFREVIRGGINRWGILARLFGSRGTKLLVEFHTKWLRFVEEAYGSAKQAQKNKDKETLQDKTESTANKTNKGKELPIIRLWEAVKQGRISEREVARRFCLFNKVGLTGLVLANPRRVPLRQPRCHHQCRGMEYSASRTAPRSAISATRRNFQDPEK